MTDLTDELDKLKDKGVDEETINKIKYVLFNNILKFIKFLRFTYSDSFYIYYLNFTKNFLLRSECKEDFDKILKCAIDNIDMHLNEELVSVFQCILTILRRLKEFCTNIIKDSLKEFKVCTNNISTILKHLDTFIKNVANNHIHFLKEKMINRKELCIEKLKLLVERSKKRYEENMFKALLEVASKEYLALTS